MRRGGTQRGASRVECHVAAANDDDALAELDAEPLIDVEEVFDGAQDTVELVAREIEVARATGADRDEQGADGARGGRRV